MLNKFSWPHKGKSYILFHSKIRRIFSEVVNYSVRSLQTRFLESSFYLCFCRFIVIQIWALDVLGCYNLLGEKSVPVSVLHLLFSMKISGVISCTWSACLWCHVCSQLQMRGVDSATMLVRQTETKKKQFYFSWSSARVDAYNFSGWCAHEFLCPHFWSIFDPHKESWMWARFLWEIVPLMMIFAKKGISTVC